MSSALGRITQKRVSCLLLEIDFEQANQCTKAGAVNDHVFILLCTYSAHEPPSELIVSTSTSVDG